VKPHGRGGARRAGSTARWPREHIEDRMHVSVAAEAPHQRVRLPAPEILDVQGGPGLGIMNNRCRRSTNIPPTMFLGGLVEQMWPPANTPGDHAWPCPHIRVFFVFLYTRSVGPPLGARARVSTRSAPSPTSRRFFMNCSVRGSELSSSSSSSSWGTAGTRKGKSYYFLLCFLTYFIS
jgi:hypothetical protein